MARIRTRRIQSQTDEMCRVTNKGSLSGTTRFLWGGQGDWQCLEERDGSGDLVARYTYAPGYIDAPARQERDLNSDGDFGDDDEVVWYHSNTLYTVYALTDGSENVVERYRYDSYGACTVLDSDFSSDADGASDVENPYAFTARRLDAESALMQYRHRYYATELGRFISRDPLGRRGERGSGYLYVLGRPARLVDPSGLIQQALPVRTIEDVLDPRFSYIDFTGDEENFGNSFFKGVVTFREDACCEQPRVVQIARTKDLQIGKDEVLDWHLDLLAPGGGPPPDDDPLWEGPVDPVLYPANPRVGKYPGLTWGDEPGQDWGIRDTVLVQEFETCLVCFDDGNCGAIIGCIRWKHHFVDPGWSLGLLGLEAHEWRHLNGFSPNGDDGWTQHFPEWFPASETFERTAEEAIRSKCARLGRATEK